MCHLHNRVLLIGITCPSSNLSQIICHPYITESTKRNYLFIIKSTSSWIVYIAQSSKYELLVHHLVSSSMLSQSHSCHLPCCHSHTLVIFHVVTVALLSNHTSSYYTSWDLTKFYHNTSYFINVRENLRGNQGIDNPETLAKYMHTTYFISFENLLFILLIAPLYWLFFQPYDFTGQWRQVSSIFHKDPYISWPFI
jgi:hypothetical protein